ncbi:hypothetical protein E4U14_002515 [Claviceps sp. LM454 group G7]|nr:hypothetical protein E4U14_002515 [Claviceps sp. LM454 group G7]
MADARSSEATFATRRYTTNSMQLGDKADRIRLLDSSVYSCDKDGTLLNKSHIPLSVPLTAVQRELVGQRTSSANALSAHSHPASNAEIHYKVVQMVAAMDALKPTTPTTTPTRKATNARASSHVAQSKGFAKLLGRLYSKSASPESEAFKKRSRLGTSEKVSCLTRSASQPDTNRPAVSSTEIRLNVDQNLDKDKVQQMMGVQSICQGSTSTFVRGHSCGQFAMGVGPEDELEVVAESGQGPEHGSRQTSWSSPNPFDTEEDFECDLDQGILHVSPAGSSTPRIRIHRSSESSAIVHIGKGERIQESKIRQVTFRIASGSNRRSSPEDCLSPDEDLGNAKKHPSPSKGDLEELERAFRRYEVRPVPFEDDLDADELAATSPTKVRRDVDIETNKVGGQSAPVGVSSTHSSRILRPLGQAVTRQKTKYQPASKYKPEGACADDVDELL